MNLERNHIIEKVFFEVNTKSSRNANLIKNNIDLLIKNELFPRLEKLFDEYDNPDQTIRFNTLDINISVDNLEKTDILNSEFERKVSEKLKIELGTLKTENVGEIESEESKQISGEQNRKAIFIFFLENGYLPWYGKEEHIIEFTKKKNWKLSLNDELFKFRLVEVLQSKSVLVERFMLQFPDEVVFSFLEKVNHIIVANSQKIRKVFTVLKDNLRVSFLRFLINISLFDEKEKWMPTLKNFYSTISENEKQLNRFAGFSFVSEFKEVIGKVVSERGIIDFKIFDIELSLTPDADSILVMEDSDSQQKNEKHKPQFIEDETTEIAIQNAGLILLHPFLNKFFEKLDLLGANGWVKSDKLDVAVQSLHYLATGDENFFEGNVIFEKYLCGALLKMPIPIESLLTEFIKDETIVLLKEVIKNWPALKNTSPDGLRQMFIHRDGKLYKKENSCNLIVERKAQDVLLDKLNWNISIVKFPWKKELLFVEW